MTICICENSQNCKHKKSTSQHVKYISILKINLTTRMFLFSLKTSEINAAAVFLDSEIK